MEIHLDMVGGIAGDMFIAAMLDAFPHLEAQVARAVASLQEFAPLGSSLQPHSDGVLRGKAFQVHLWKDGSKVSSPMRRDTHPHKSWESIRSQLEQSDLAEPVRHRAIEIFELLAVAEGFVHGIDPALVEFHEVGAWDSLADIVGASVLIEAVGAVRWTTSAAPLGSGRVKTAHGVLPIPAPATAQLLLGMATIDDGVAGERVTPTGAAILRHLCPPSPPRTAAATPTPRNLVGTGTGFGQRTFSGISNHLRVLCFEANPEPTGDHRHMHVLEFEVDDQSGEELAAGLERLRGHPAVLDVTQAPVLGKKCRLMTHVQVLVRYARLNDVVEACFKETTTIGLRHRTVEGIGLKRSIQEVTIDGHRLRVKVVQRPDGLTAKAECDDVLPHAGHAVRRSLRARAEAAALREALTTDA